MKASMRVILLYFVTICSGTINAQDLIFLNPVVNCTSTSNDGVHTYNVGGLIKNVSGKRVSISKGTTGIHVGGQYSKPKEYYLFWSTMLTTKMFGVQLTPSVSELNIVELHPDEGYYFKGTTKSKENIYKSYLEFTSNNILDGRFGTWVGKVRSTPVSVGMVKDCALPKK